jgi:pimeloyl-ACP methyl ester carboxylesterase
VPALVLIGEKDETMDVAKNLATYRRIQAENRRMELRVIPDAGHSLQSGGRFAADFPQLVADRIPR